MAVRLFLFGGAPGRIRTCDFQLRRLTLYPLSYGRDLGLSIREMGRIIKDEG